MLFSRVYGIDLGTSTVKIYDKKKNSITKEKNMIAIRQNDTVFAVGNEAYDLFERTPADIEVETPMSNGRISDVMMMEVIIHTLLGRVRSNIGARPTIYFSVPMDMTEIERRAYYSIAHRGKLKKCRVFLVEKPIADAFALGIPINKTKGSMIVNIGAESCEVSVIADQRVIISKIIPIGGKQFNTAIAAGVRRKNNFQISRKTAKRLKTVLANLKEDPKETRKVEGIDVTTGLPRDGIVTSQTVNQVISQQMQLIADEIRKFLERTPPQVHANIMKEGIYLTGGSTQIVGMDQFLTQALGCPVQLSGYYDLCTICGIKELINHETLQRWAFTAKRK